MKLLFLILFWSLAAAAGPLQQISSQADFDSFLRESNFNGVLLVAKDDRILFKRAFGFKNLTTKTPLSADDKFQIGSVTKQFVAASILRLQDLGLLSIDDDVVKYLPGLPGLAGIKIRDVLNHTAGIFNYTDERAFWQIYNFNKLFELNDILGFIKTLPAEFAPRTRYKYSNSGYVVAGKIVEAVSGQSWNDFIRTQFLNPLQMNDSGYEGYFSKVSDVEGYVDSDGVITPVRTFNQSWALAAGGMYSTLEDLLKWTAIYESTPFLSDQSRAQMQTPFLGDYGLGVIVDKFNGQTRITHSGRTPGFVTSLTYLKGSRLKVISFDSHDGGSFDAGDLALNFYHYGNAQVLKQKPFPISPDSLHDYVGSYKGQTMQVRIYIKDGKLFFKTSDDQPPYPLVANDKDSFRLLNISGEEFIRDQNGSVTGFRHFQKGSVSIFTKN